MEKEYTSEYVRIDFFIFFNKIEIENDSIKFQRIMQI